jgi:hypothetical protein
LYISINIALIFYACLVSTELLIEHSHIETFDGIGVAAKIRMDLSRGDTDLPFNVFLASLGVQFGCDTCGQIDGEKAIIPLSSTLREGNVVDREVLVHFDQGIVVMAVSCMTLELEVGYIPPQIRVQFIVHGITRGQHSASLDIEIQSRTGFVGVASIRRCLATTMDRRASVSVRYYTYFSTKTSHEKTCYICCST